jgi:hypothetical protein
MNTISEGSPVASPLSLNQASLPRHTPASLDLIAEVREASQLRSNGDNEGSRLRSTMVSRADLRLAAVNEMTREQPSSSTPVLPIDRDTARRWVELDALEFGRTRSEIKRADNLDIVATNARVSPDYQDALSQRSPAIAGLASALNQERDKQEAEQLRSNLENQRQAKVNARAAERQELIDGAALAAVAKIRQEQSSAVLANMPRIPDPTEKEIADTKRALNTPALDGGVVSQYDPDIALKSARALKRPILEDELTLALRGRYVVSHEKSGFLHIGSTDFTFRAGQMQGRVAFIDSGKSITSELEDKATIRSMVELASIKNWKTVTITGSEEFRRNAWLEASIAGLKVNGYEPRETDKKLLVEIENTAFRREPPPAIDQKQQPSLNTRDESVDRAAARAASSQRIHIDADTPTSSEQAVLDSSRSFMKGRSFSDAWTDAALNELSKKLRAQRVYIGELINHGYAPFKFDEKNDDSYFVTLKTSRGEKVIWGKELPDAMTGRVAGEMIVLQNTGKKGVVVDEREYDGDKVVGIRKKDAIRNEWTVEPLANFAPSKRDDVLKRAQPREPVMRTDALRETSASPAARESERSVGRPINPDIEP